MEIRAMAKAFHRDDFGEMGFASDPGRRMSEIPRPLIVQAMSRGKKPGPGNWEVPGPSRQPTMASRIPPRRAAIPTPLSTEPMALSPRLFFQRFTHLVIHRVH